MQLERLLARVRFVLVFGALSACASASVSSWRRYGKTLPVMPNKSELQQAPPEFLTELPQSDADIRAFDQALHQLIAPTI